MTCCQRLNKCYLITVNFLFACFGCGLIAFGVMGIQQKFEGAILYPANILKMINILGVLILFTAVIGTISAFYRDNKMIHVIYSVVVLIAFAFQVITAVCIYQLAANSKPLLSFTWNESLRNYREYAQNKFQCCGFSNVLDHPAETDTCSTTDPHMSKFGPCFDPLTKFVTRQLSTSYIILFSALSIEILAICNSITLLCSRMIHSDTISLDHFKSNSTTMTDSTIHKMSSNNRMNNHYDMDQKYSYAA
ncbi:Tetraspanin family-domain-containing protein [Cunninghamella echinulata]|nr:Tetraspanin family-domain-containing protein [Cunninghamella echinulata]